MEFKYKIIKSTFSVECNKNRVVILMSQNAPINLPTDFAYGSLAVYIAGNDTKVHMLDISGAWKDVTGHVTISGLI